MMKSTIAVTIMPGPVSERRAVQMTEASVNRRRKRFRLREKSAAAPSGGASRAAMAMERLTARPQSQRWPPAIWPMKYRGKMTVTMMTENAVLPKSKNVQPMMRDRFRNDRTRAGSLTASASVSWVDVRQYRLRRVRVRPW